MNTVGTALALIDTISREVRPCFVCADIHAWNHRLLGGSTVNGLNRRNQEIFAVVRAACEVVRRKDGVLVVAGDVFDAPRPSPQVERAMMDAFSSLTGDGKRSRVFLLVGNHDRVTNNPGDNALAPLGRLPGVVVIDDPRVLDVGGRQVLFVPPPPHGTTFEAELCGVVDTLGTTSIEVMVIHAGVEDNNTPTFLRGSHSAISVLRLAALARSLGVREVYAGDWHEPKLWDVDGVKIVQCGALVPTGWDNPGHGYGRLHEVGASFRHYTLHGPRFIVAPDDCAAEQALRTIVAGPGTKDIYYVRSFAPSDKLVDVSARLGEIAEETGNHVWVLPTPKETGAAGAGGRVRAGVDEALVRATEGVVEDMVVRPRVLERSRRYLAAAGGE